MDSSYFKTSLGKKLIAVALCVTAFVFLSISVFGTTYNPTTYNSYSDAVTYNNVTYYVKVTQLKALSEGTSMLPGGMETIMLVQLQMTNNSSVAKACTIPKLSIDISDERVITDVYTYGGDFILGLLTGGTVVFYPESDFSLDNNKVIVPPNKSLYCVGAIGLPAQLNQTGDGTLDTGLRGVHLYDKSNYNVADTSSSYGDPVDLSLVISTIEDLIDTVSTSDELQDLIDAVMYSGNAPTYTLGSGNSSSVDKRFSTDYMVQIHRFVSQPYLIYSDTLLDPSNDNAYQNASVRYDIKLIISETVTNSNLSISASNIITGILPNGSYGNLVVDNMFTNSFESYNLKSNRLTLYRKNASVISSRYILNMGYQVSVINAHITLPYGNSITFGNMSLDSFTSYYDRTDVYAPVSEYYILRDLYLAYSSVNGLDDIDDTAEEITDKSESAHVQEQNYFAQNAQAIQSTGLSNYQFSGDQENGIGSVSHDFTLVWNALGGFNSIYIFSLTLSLALMILRHAPSAIKSSRRNKEE